LWVALTFVSGEVPAEDDERAEDGEHHHGDHPADDRVVDLLGRAVPR
jgi:hypothetical protein